VTRPPGAVIAYCPLPVATHLPPGYPPPVGARTRSPVESEGTTVIPQSNDGRGGLSVIVSCAAGVSIVHLQGVRSAVLGRSASCDVVVRDSSVSRKHAILHLAEETSGQETTIEDLGSRNGTSLDQQRLRPRERVSIVVGSRIQLGSASLVLERTRDSPSGGSQDDSQGDARGPSQPVGSASDSVIVNDAAMVRLYAMLDVVAPSELPVLLLGETGVGKEVFAAALHARSPRSKAPFVTVNCAAIPETLIEAELFGYERGAFTGAAHAKMGLFEAAHGGTIFLDEMGELPMSMQPKLLRVLETGELTRLGAVRSSRVHVRLVSATNRNLAALAAPGLFRSDLLYRINAVTLTIPALRDRRTDIVPLARHFVALACSRQGRPLLKIAPDAIVALKTHDWPGNVRELRNAMERAVVLCSGPLLERSHFALPHGARLDTRAANTPPSSPVVEPLRDSVGAFEKERVLEALRVTGGNQTRAAKNLGLARRTFINMLERHGIPGPRKTRI